MRVIPKLRPPKYWEYRETVRSQTSMCAIRWDVQSWLDSYWEWSSRWLLSPSAKFCSYSPFERKRRCMNVYYWYREFTDDRFKKRETFNFWRELQRLRKPFVKFGGSLWMISAFLRFPDISSRTCQGTVMTWSYKNCHNASTEMLIM